MPKKVMALFIILIFVFSFFPMMSLAATTHDVADGQTLDLSTGELTLTVDDSAVSTYSISDGDTINVAASAIATITGSKNVMIACGVGVELTIEDVTINVSGTSGACALSFSGDSDTEDYNTLDLVGVSILTSGENEPGICVEGSTVLTISGSGSVATTSGNGGAGIGGGHSSNSGDIEINSGTITATGNLGGAGIGGGNGDNEVGGGFTRIAIGGTANVTATANNSDAAGVGCGD